MRMEECERKKDAREGKQEWVTGRDEEGKTSVYILIGIYFCRNVNDVMIVFTSQRQEEIYGKPKLGPLLSSC